MGHTNVGQEGKLELQPRVRAGVVEEADILSLEKKAWRHHARPRALSENPKVSHPGGQLQGIPGVAR